MDEIKNTGKEQEYITEKDARDFRELFERCLASYKKKAPEVTDKQWLDSLFKAELPEISAEESEKMAEETVESIKAYDENYKSVNEAAEKGVSKEKWLSDKLQEATTGMAVHECGQMLQTIDDVLYQKNMELAEALKRASDGNIKMSPNLDGNIAENMVAKTTELNAFLQNKNIKVEVRDVFTENSVDVRAINLDTGKYQNYQLKFGKDAKSTIALIERGNYNNQQIIVPTEQLDEVKAHFAAKGSNKTITDRIDAWGAEGKPFTKEEMKKLQIAAQEDGLMPSMDYSHYNTKDLTMAIGKNAGALALQNAAITTGFTIANKIWQGEEIDGEELAEIAIKSGADASVKAVTAGALQVGVRKGIIRCIPKATPAGVIANIACVAVEDAKILYKVAKGELSVSKGLDAMGRTTVSMIGGLAAIKTGAAVGAALTAWIPVIGPGLAVVTGFLGGMVGYACGSKIGEKIYEAGKKVAKVAKTVGKAAVDGIKKVGRKLAEKGRKLKEILFG